jgi:hypothetical protein
MSDLVFDAEAKTDEGGSCLQGYVYLHPSEITPYTPGSCYYDDTVYDKTWTFERILAGINAIANQVIFDDGNFDKSSFTAEGTYKGKYFSLYDYKGDRSIHVGGGNELDVKGLVDELNKLIKLAEPKPFSCRCSYTNAKYRYPK